MFLFVKFLDNFFLLNKTIVGTVKCSDYCVRYYFFSFIGRIANFT